MYLCIYLSIYLSIYRCAESHYRLLQHIALTGEPRALVLEQDSRLAPAAAAPAKAADVLSRALAQVPEDAYIGLWA